MEWDKAKNLLLWTLLILIIILKIFSAPVTNPNYYPFIFSDTWQYISQGLHYLGAPIPDYYRPPVFSIFIALLYKIGAERYLGFIPLVFSMLLAVSLFIITEKLFGRTVAFLTSFLALANKQIFIYSYLLNADIICVALITFSIALVFLEKKWLTICAWGACALSFYAQNAVFAPLLLLVALIFIQGKNFYKEKENIAGLMIFCVLIIVYFFIFFDYSSSSSRHIRWFAFMKLKHIKYYLLGILFEMHFSGIVLLLIGIIVVWLNQKGKGLFLLFFFLPSYLFFTFFYYYEYQRFILYYNIPLIIMIGYGLSEVTRKLKFQSFKIAIIIWALLYQNTPGFSKSLRFDNTEMALSPHLTLTNDWALKNEANMPLLWQVMRSDTAQLNAQGDFNLFPEVTDILSKHLNSRLEEGDVFAVFPFTTPPVRGQFTEKLQALSKRTAMNLKNSELRSPELKALVYIRLPDNIYTPRELALREKVMSYIAASGKWNLQEYNEYIHVYFKKQTYYNLPTE